MDNRNTKEINSRMLEDFSLSKKILFVLFNYATSLLLLLTLWVFLSSHTLGVKVALGLSVLYLLPPLLARIALLISPIKRTHIPFGSTEFMTWWFLSSIQTIYSRFPLLEELLRSIPSLYSMWLRLWGAKIGKMTFWAPNTTILDRSYLEIGDFVSFGAGVRLNPHVISKNSNGESELLLASIVICDNALVGGYSLLTTGTKISANETTNSFLRSPPFCTWKDNRRIKKPSR
jgi:hypothetical protein